jgi:hypothetical protein
MKHNQWWLIAVLVACLPAACINIRTELQPANTDVKPALAGEDCSLILLGFGLGRNRFADAMNGAAPGLGYDPDRRHAPIQRVRSVEFHNWQFLGLVGQQCLEIWGE